MTPVVMVKAVLLNTGHLTMDTVLATGAGTVSGITFLFMLSHYAAFLQAGLPQHSGVRRHHPQVHLHPAALVFIYHS